MKEKYVDIPKSLFNMLITYHVNGERSNGEEIKNEIERVTKNRAIRIIYKSALKENNPDRRKELLDLYSAMKENKSVTITLPLWAITERTGEKGKFFSVQIPMGTVMDNNKDIGGYKFTAKYAELGEFYGDLSYSKDTKILLKKYEKKGEEWKVEDEVKISVSDLKYFIDRQKQHYEENKKNAKRVTSYNIK